ncbi:MAG: NAD(P)-dependent glycerol-3-phosphate dehydrogenase [bacterium]|nr:NAD(P)-dependent glycerol-3-phosphate dehydrogenase [bacterium]
MSMQKIGVVGAGAWGTALAQTLTSAGRDVTLWAYEKDEVSLILEHQENKTYLPGIRLDPAIQVTNDLAQIADNDALLMVVPAQFMRGTATQLAAHLKPNTPTVICSKGIEQGSGKLLTQVLEASLPKATIAALSGPSFAIEVARGLPAAVTLACEDTQLGAQLAAAIAHRNFRVYLSDDLMGVEVGGAIKNVLAIAAGIVEGKQLGKSAHAAVITRGFAELMRFALAFGAKRETMDGLSGLGDLVLTCSSPTSRNMSFGHALGGGTSVSDILAARNSVTEGMYTAIPVTRIAREKGIEMPICEAVRNIIWGGVEGYDYPALSVDAAIEGLLSRPIRGEKE